MFLRRTAQIGYFCKCLAIKDLQRPGGRVCVTACRATLYGYLLVKSIIPFLICDPGFYEFTLPRREIRHGILDQFAVLPSVNLILGNGDVLCVGFPSEGRLSRNLHDGVLA